MASRASAVVAVACVGALAVFASVALADGDPASDYLLSQAAFVPPDAGVPAASAKQLATLLQAAKARGYVIRVALIGSRYDMGSVTPLYRKPKPYARFLGQELYFVYKGKLLVVMPNGYGVSQAGKALPAQERLVDRLGAPKAGGAGLADAASAAVHALALADGVNVPMPALGSTAGSSSNHDRVVIGVAAAVAVLLLGIGAYLRRGLRTRGGA